MKKRTDSSFGLHFDFHASPYPGRPAVGATLKEKDIREICRTIRPDFLQIDCKGHPGWASYPTECGNAMPEFVGDPLELWRRVTREEGVALYMHYSGVIDYNYCAKHPEDAVMNPDGSRSEGATRTLGSYVDNLVIPQLMELAGKYGVDGVWLDGECWGTTVDYHPDTVAAFERECGIDLEGKLPVKHGDPYYDEYREFNRELFRRYVRHYTDAVHEKYPDFQIASNWAFSDHMPEAVSANVDFLSGDFNPWNSYNIARYAGRTLAGQDRTWDLMAWNFRHQDADRPPMMTKHPVQIMQEASTILAVGGGFQTYITQYPDGAPRMEEIRPMTAVAEFVRARIPYCFRGKAEHEAVILLSTHDRSLESEGLYSRGGYMRVVGITTLVCDTGRSVEIACEHNLMEKCGDFKLIILPELAYGLAPETMDGLLNYAKRGGSLLLTGVNTCKLFADYSGLFTIDRTDHKDNWRWLTIGSNEFAKIKDLRSVTAENAEIVATLGESQREMNQPAAVILPYGKGKIALIAGDIGTQYGACNQYMHRKLIDLLCDKLYTPKVKAKALGTLEMVELNKDGKLFIQLINANGNHASMECATEDQIPPIVDIKLQIKLDKAPKVLILQPEGKEIPFDYKDGIAAVEIDRINLYDILEVVE
ncbi:MAG: hypothetical protein J6I45_12130 [Clostridia bacterium]|nr:hypothetical protein [Clostridia bacterium]